MGIMFNYIILMNHLVLVELNVKSQTISGHTHEPLVFHLVMVHVQKLLQYHVERMELPYLIVNVKLI